VLNHQGGKKKGGFRQRGKKETKFGGKKKSTLLWKKSRVREKGARFVKPKEKKGSWKRGTI